MRRLWLALAVAALFLVPASAPARSLDFSGSTSTISYLKFETLSGRTSLTWMAWLNPDAVAVRAWLLNDSGNTTFSVGIDTTTCAGGLRFDVHNGGGRLCAAVNLPVGEWTHVALSWDGSAAVGSRTQLYYNGVLQTVTENAGTVFLTIADTTALIVADTITTDYNGRMYNMKIFGGPSSQEQIQADMLCYRPQGSDLIFWLPMDQGDKVVTDYAGGRTGTGIPTSGVSVSESTPPVEFCGAGG